MGSLEARNRKYVTDSAILAVSAKNLRRKLQVNRDRTEGQLRQRVQLCTSILGDQRIDRFVGYGRGSREHRSDYRVRPRCLL